MRRARLLRCLGLAVVGCLLLTGCGLNSTQLVPAPGGPGTEDGSYTVHVRFANVANLVPHAEVKVDNVNAGVVRTIALHGWQAQLELSLSPDVTLPANAVADIGQKSLLGAQYVELSAPADAPPTGTLRQGDLIPVARTNRYPGTEELLAALSLWLNGGGLRQVRTITDELNNALSGHERQARDLIGRLDTLASSADEQKNQILRAIDAVDGLTQRLRANSGRLGRAVEELGPGLRVLNEQRGNLRTALNAVDRLGTVGTDVLNRSRDGLLANLRDLRPTLRRLVEAGDAVPKSLDLLGTMLFPLSTYKKVVRGDFLNLAATLDMSLPSLDSGLLAGTPLGGVLNAATTALQATDPVRGPLGLPRPTGDAAERAQPPRDRAGPTDPPRAPGGSSAPGPGEGGLLGGLLGGG